MAHVKYFQMKGVWGERRKFELRTYTDADNNVWFYLQDENYDVESICRAIKDFSGGRDKSTFIDDLQLHMFGYQSKIYDNELPMCKSFRDCRMLFAELSKEYIAYENGGSLPSTIKIEKRLLSESLRRGLMRIGCPLSHKILHVARNQKLQKRFTKNVTINSKGEMTFSPKGKRPVLKNYYTWEPKGRQSSKYGKTILKIVQEQNLKNVTARDIELLVNALKAMFSPSGSFEIVEGEDITYWYHEDQYKEDTNIGTLGDSCMMHDECQGYFQMYEEHTRMLILTDKNKRLIGRALLWNVKGKTYMDRIYGSDYVVSKFQQYAKKEGWYSKEKQSYDNRTTWVDPKTGKIEKITFQIPIEKRYDDYPYLDTFTFCLSGQYISNSQDDAHDRVLNDTSGGWEENERTWCDHDQEYYDNDEVRRICDDHYDGWAYEGHSQYCEVTEEYHLEDNMVETEKGEYVYVGCDDLIQLDNGDYYLQDDLAYCDYKERDFPIDEVVFVEKLALNIHHDYIEDAFIEYGWVKNDESDEWEQVTEDEQVIT